VLQASAPRHGSRQHHHPTGEESRPEAGISFCPLTGSHLPGLQCNHTKHRYDANRLGFYYLFVVLVVVVIRHETTAAARWALLLVAGAFSMTPLPLQSGHWTSSVASSKSRSAKKAKYAKKALRPRASIPLAPTRQIT